MKTYITQKIKECGRVKKIALYIVCGIALLGCAEALELQVVNGGSYDSAVYVSDIQLSEDSPLQDIGAYYELGGDMAIAKNDPLTSEIVALLSGDPRYVNSARGAKKSHTSLWENNTVRYYFAEGNILMGYDSNGNPVYRFGSPWTDGKMKRIRQAMHVIESVCGVRYEEYQPSVHSYSRPLSGKYAIIYDQSLSLNGMSTLGYQENNWMAMKVFNDRTSVHELLHGLGIMHEHQRNDRDVNIFCDSINKDDIDTFKNNDNFKRYTGNVQYFTSYDFKSIMHYLGYGHSNGHQWMRSLRYKNMTIGSNYLSFHDKASLVELYGAPKNNEYHVDSFLKGDNLLIKNDSGLSIYNGEKQIIKAAGNEVLFDTSGNQSWRLNCETDKFYYGNFDGGNDTEILVTSDWGIGILFPNLYYGLLRSSLCKPNGTRFGGWNYWSTRDEILAIEDFDGDGADEILIRSDWGIGLLKYNKATSTFDDLGCYKNGNYIGGWKIYNGQKFIRFGNFDRDKDGAIDILVESDWGLGILAFDKNTKRLTSRMVKPFGTNFDGWNLYKGQVFPAVGDFDGAEDIGRQIYKGDEILVNSDWGTGVLKYENGTLRCIMARKADVSQFRYGFDVDYISDDSGYVRVIVSQVADFDNDGREEIFGYRKTWGGTRTDDKIYSFEDNRFVSDYHGTFSANYLGFKSGELLTNWYGENATKVEVVDEYSRQRVFEFTSGSGFIQVDMY